MSKYSKFRVKKRTYRPNRTRKRRMNRTRKRRVNRASKVVVRNISVIPDRYFCKMRYDQTYVLGSASLVYTYNVFRGNSLFDPDLTGTGHQPLGFDQMTNLYGKYIVFGSKMTCRFSNDSGNTYQMAIYPTLSASSPPSSIDTVAEQIYSKRTMMNGGDGDGTRVLKGYMSSRKMFGLKKVTDEDDNFTSVTGTSPANQWYWNVYAFAPNNAPFGSSSLVVQTEITYFCEFFSRLTLSSS